MTNAQSKFDQLFYDGGCPLCQREISALKRLSDSQLRFTDLLTLPAQETAQHPARDTLMRSLHLRSADGHWLVGIDATVQAWSHTAVGFLWRPLRWPILGAVADRVYSLWARRRYQRRSACVVCRVPPT